MERPRPRSPEGTPPAAARAQQEKEKEEEKKEKEKEKEKEKGEERDQEEKETKETKEKKEEEKHAAAVAAWDAEVAADDQRLLEVARQHLEETRIEPDSSSSPSSTSTPASSSSSSSAAAAATTPAAAPTPSAAAAAAASASAPAEGVDDTIEGMLVRKDRRGGLYGERHMRLLVEQDDPTSPLHSVSEFKDLNLRGDLLQGIYEMGYNRPSRIQECALPVILARRNLIAQAQSGTGKTAAFVLGILSFVDIAQPVPQAVCCCPTRELARQIVDVVGALGKFTRVRTQLAVPEEIARSAGPITAQIVVGTPGTLLDLVQRNKLAPGQVGVFVLDEADVMIDVAGLGTQSLRLKQRLPRQCQTLLFSATFPERVKKFADRISGTAFKIWVKQEDLKLKKIQQLFIDCGSEANRYTVLSDVYAFLTVGQSIVFVQTRQTCDRLGARLNDEGHPVSLLHGGREVSAKQRDRIIDEFREGKTRVLIATNVLARGIDIEDVRLVINYDLPVDQWGKADPETYLHRIGRCGRFGRHGIAINLVHDEHTRGILRVFETHFKCKIEPFPADRIENLQELLEQLRVKDAQDIQEREQGGGGEQGSGGGGGAGGGGTAAAVQGGT